MMPKFMIRDVIKKSLSFSLRHYLVLLLIGGVFLFFNNLLYALSSKKLLFSGIAFIIQVYLSLFLTKLILFALHRGYFLIEDATVSLKQYVNALLYVVLFILLLTLFILPSLSFSVYAALLAFIIYTILFIPYFFGIFYILTRGAGIKESLKLCSKHFTGARFKILLTVILYFLLLGIAGLVLHIFVSAFFAVLRGAQITDISAKPAIITSILLLAPFNLSLFPMIYYQFSTANIDETFNKNEKKEDELWMH